MQEAKNKKKEKGIMEIWSEAHFAQPEMHEEQTEEEEEGEFKRK